MPTSVTTMTTAQLEAVDPTHDCTYEDDCPDCRYLLAVERELDRRDYDEEDPWSPQNHHD